MSESRRVKLTKKMLKDAMIELLDKKPFNKISVTEICEVADVNRSTFYAYYEDTTFLLHEIEDDVLKQIPFDLKIDKTPYNEQSIKQITAFFEYIKNNASVFRILLLKFDDSEFNHKLIELVFNHYNKKDNKDLTIKYGYIFAIDGVIGITKEWIENDFPISSKKFAEIALKMAINSNH